MLQPAIIKSSNPAYTLHLQPTPILITHISSGHHTDHAGLDGGPQKVIQAPTFF